ncbi:GlcNAc-PI de-N-acetylase [Candidatus Marinamargulisbacteria bacterium SCGC AG-410-N11]|nr:GlcNAc-PI de-N-acetylase [Candidatus Marinamargulisbacteria bacterium SCGC AG-410-N11]
MKNILVFAIHPDDETLGCGGTLLKHKNDGDKIHWLIATHLFKDQGYSDEVIEKRNKEIITISNLYSFDSVHQLNLKTTECDQYSMNKLISRISAIINKVKPTVIYLPFKSDVHSDHRICFDAIYACTKVFRYPFIKKILMMETLSETDFALATKENAFVPNVFVDISNYIEQKCNAMAIYESEVSPHPFPRSIETIKALAKVRGACAGVNYAESFMLLKEINS